MGDILVFVFFGIVPVCITYYIQLHTCTWQVFVASVACGAVVDCLLIVNNYRDRDNDKRDGKKTLVVELGAEAAERAYLFMGVFAVLAGVIFWLNGHVLGFLLPLLYLVMHVLTWQNMCRIHEGRELNTCLAETARNMLVYGLLVSIGILLI
jgi:1,4-dihydroxy-2-naphthoate octaprenyltransferase